MNDFPELLPDSVVNRRFLTSRLRLWTGVWFITTLATLYVCCAQEQRMTDLRLTADSLAAQSAPLTVLQNEQRQMQKEVAAIQERESWLVESDSQQALQLLGIISQAAANNHGRISVRSLNLNSFERAIDDDDQENARGNEEKQLEQRMKLNLSGVAVDDLSVASFVAGLRESGVFESVELRSSERQVFENHESRQYDVTCVY